MAIKHIFPNVNKCCDSDSIRPGLKCITFLIIIVNIYWLLVEISNHLYFDLIVTLIFLIPHAIFFKNLYKPNRTFLNFFRFYILAILVYDIVQYFLIILSAFTNPNKFKQNYNWKKHEEIPKYSLYLLVLLNVSLLLIRIYIHLVYGAYSEQIIDELDNVSDTKELEEN